MLALVGFFVAGVSSIAHLRRGFRPAPVVLVQVFLLLVPLLLLLIARLWAPSCSIATGLMFFGLFPVISVVLAAGLASFMNTLKVKRPTVMFVGVGVAISVLTPIYDLGLHPQLYTYNHVFGGVLGPIYDEELAIRPGLFAFRLMTLVWATLLFLASAMIRCRAGFGSPIAAGAVAATAALAIGYLHSDELGWNTTHDLLQKQLISTRITEHFEIHYDERAFLPGDVGRLVSEMEFRYAWISRRLDTAVPDKILVYLYPTAQLKGRLTGSRYSSVTPIWLPRPQIHMLARRVDESFDHELVHVFSREFGLPLIRASLSVGLVEGLASALESPDGRPSARDLMAATIMSGDRDSSGTVNDVVAGLSAFGFWTGRGAVSYAASGSLVDYLLRAYGAGPLKAAYATSDFERAYGRTIEELVGEWYHDLRSAEYVSAAALPTAQRLFSIPSLFEMECPHEVPGYVSAYREASDYLSVYDTTSALSSLQQAVALNGEYLPAVLRLGAVQMRKGQWDEARQILSHDSTRAAYPTFQLLEADLAAVGGQADAASRLYTTLLDSLPGYALEARAAVLLRNHYASRVDIVRSLVAQPDLAGLHRALAGDPAAPTVRLVSNLRANRYHDACEAGLAEPHYLEAGFSSNEEFALTAQHLSWLGEACEAAENIREAERAYSRAAKAYASIGLMDHWRLAIDRQERVRWKLSREAGRRSN